MRLRALCRQRRLLIFKQRSYVDHAKVIAALDRVEAFLNAYPTASDTNIRAFAARHQWDLLLIIPARCIHLRNEILNLKPTQHVIPVSNH